MSGRVFLDTNIFIYSFDHRDPVKRDLARKLIADALESGHGRISYQVVQEFMNVALRRFASPMTTDEAKTYLHHVLLPLWDVQSGEGLMIDALEIQQKWRLSWYDSLIVASALAAGCGTLLSEDLQHGLRIRSLQVVNPFRS